MDHESSGMLNFQIVEFKPQKNLESVSRPLVHSLLQFTGMNLLPKELRSSWEDFLFIHKANNSKSSGKKVYKRDKFHLKCLKFTRAIQLAFLKLFVTFFSSFHFIPVQINLQRVPVLLEFDGFLFSICLHFPSSQPARVMKKKPFDSVSLKVFPFIPWENGKILEYHQQRERKKIFQISIWNDKKNEIQVKSP